MVSDEDDFDDGMDESLIPEAVDGDGVVVLPDEIALRNADEEEISPKDLASILVSRVKADFDAVIAISGDEGMGKSSFAILIAMLICKLLKMEFSLDNNVIYVPDADKVKHKVLYELKKYAPIIMDEAITLLYKLNWNSKAQRIINILYSVCRKENKVTVLCIPNFFDLNTFFRNRRVILWVEVIGRGRAVLFMRDWSPFSQDRWHTKESQKIIEKKSKNRSVISMNADAKIELLRKCPNYVCCFTYPDLEKDVKREYKKRTDDVKYELKLDSDGEEQGVARRYRIATQKAVVAMAGANKTQQEIATDLDLGIGTVNRLLKEAGVRKVDRP